MGENVRGFVWGKMYGGLLWEGETHVRTPNTTNTARSPTSILSEIGRGVGGFVEEEGGIQRVVGS